jgi:hypothetical protein
MLNVPINSIMLSVIMLSIVLLNVVAPLALLSASEKAGEVCRGQTLQLTSDNCKLLAQKFYKIVVRTI